MARRPDPMAQAWRSVIAAPREVVTKPRSRRGALAAGAAGLVMVGGGAYGANEYRKRKNAADVEKSSKSEGRARARQIAQEREAAAAAAAAEGREPEHVAKPKPARPKPPAPEPLPPLPERHSLAGKLSRAKMPNRYAVAGLLAAGGGVGAYELASKASSDDAKVGAAGVVGGAAGAAGAAGSYQLAGYRASKYIERKQRGKLSTQEKRVVNAHRKEHGIPTGEDFVKAPESVKDAYFRSYPENVRYGGARRLLARTHGAHNPGRLTVPAALVGAAVGGGAAAGAAQRHVDKALATAARGVLVRKPKKVPLPVLGQKYRDELGRELERAGATTVSNGVRKDLLMPSWNRLGIPPWRVDPISPLVTLASGNIMLDQAAAAAGKNLNRRERKAAQRSAYAFSGALGMMGSPMGAGRKVVQ